MQLHFTGKIRCALTESLFICDCNNGDGGSENGDCKSCVLGYEVIFRLTKNTVILKVELIMA